MTSIRSNPLIALAAIALLLNAQFVHIAHVHADVGDDKSEHADRPHVHLGYNHCHTHAHGHHNHSHAAPVKVHRSAKATVAYAGAPETLHDHDALYLNACDAQAIKNDASESTVKPCGASQLFDWGAQFAFAYSGRAGLAPSRPPDPTKPMAIFRLNQAILC